MPVSPKDVGVVSDTSLFDQIDAILAKPWSVADKRNGRCLRWKADAISYETRRVICDTYREVGWDVDYKFDCALFGPVYVVFTFRPPQVRA